MIQNNLITWQQKCVWITRFNRLYRFHVSLWSNVYYNVMTVMTSMFSSCSFVRLRALDRENERLTEDPLESSHTLRCVESCFRDSGHVRTWLVAATATLRIQWTKTTRIALPCADISCYFTPVFTAQSGSRAIKLKAASVCIWRGRAWAVFAQCCRYNRAEI